MSWKREYIILFSLLVCLFSVYTKKKIIKKWMYIDKNCLFVTWLLVFCGFVNNINEGGSKEMLIFTETYFCLMLMFLRRLLLLFSNE